MGQKCVLDDSIILNYISVGLVFLIRCHEINRPEGFVYMEHRLRRALEALGITPSEDQIQAAKRTLTLREERNYIEMYLSGEIDGP